MHIERCTLPAVTVIGREGSTHDGPGFIQRLWSEANEHFPEIANLVRIGEDGAPTGFWGAMSDFSRAFHPWENQFSEGLYLAGAECRADATPPEGWTKWTLPPHEYLKVEQDGPETFPSALQYIDEHGLSLAGAVHDFTCPATGKGYMLFPIQAR